MVYFISLISKIMGPFFRKAPSAFILIIVFLFQAGAFAGEPSYGEYPAPDAMVDEIYALARDYPDNAEIIEYGTSVEGRALLAVRIAANLDEEKPEAMIVAAIHGNEWIGNRVATAAAWRLLRGLESDPWISGMLDNMDFIIIPCINPDGYYRTQEILTDNTILWRNARKNANRVDLNRNFPLPGERTMDIDMAGVEDDPDHERYTGPSPYSEPETIALRDFIAARRIFASVDLHSNWGTIFPPKCNSGTCEKQFKKMCDASIERQPHNKYPCVMSRHADSFSGEMEDALFYDFGIMAVCWEVFPTNANQEQLQRLSHIFWVMNPEDIDYWVENDRDAILAALEAAFGITKGSPVPEKHRNVKY